MRRCPQFPEPGGLFLGNRTLCAPERETLLRRHSDQIIRQSTQCGMVVDRRKQPLPIDRLTAKNGG
jgi:hypothetical protein